MRDRSRASESGRASARHNARHFGEGGGELAELQFPLEPGVVRALDRLHGDDDQVVPFSVGGQASAALIEGATLKGYPGAPHGITDTHKEQLGNDLLDFLNSSGDATELVGASTGKENP